MKKTLGVIFSGILVLALVFAMVPGVSAQALFNDKWVVDEAIMDPSRFAQKEDGTITISGKAEASGNTGLALAETSYFSGDFTVEMKVKVPSEAAGSSVIYLFGQSTGFWPTAGLMIKLSNFADGREFGWEIYNYGFAPSSTGNAGEQNDRGAKVSADWNTLKIEVTGTNAKITINGAVIENAFAFTRPADCNHLGLGINENRTDGTEFKDIKITKGGEVVFTTIPAGSDTGSSEAGSGTDSSNPDTADTAVVASVILMAAAGALAVAAVRARKIRD